jgi:nucleotide-binding universal stress UspA family protein
MFRRIIVPLDGSKEAERAILVAAQLARASNGSIVFVRVVPPPMEYGKFSAPHLNAWEKQFHERSRAQAGSYLAAALLNHASELAGIDTEIGVATGLVAPAIFSGARREEADLIVLCGQDAVGVKRLMYGSVAQEAALHSPVPALLLHDNGGSSFLPSGTRPLHVLAALDGSAQAERALETAVQLLAAWAGRGQATLHLLRAVDLPPVLGTWHSQAHIDLLTREEAQREAENYLESIAHRIRADDRLPATVAITATVIAEENIARAIALVGEGIERTERGANVVVAMATEEHRKLWRLFMGDAAERVLHSTRFPLLVAHPRTANQAQIREKMPREF